MDDAGRQLKGLDRDFPGPDGGELGGQGQRRRAADGQIGGEGPAARTYGRRTELRKSGDGDRQVSGPAARDVWPLLKTDDLVPGGAARAEVPRVDGPFLVRQLNLR